jgi:chaperone required for assembly of F1-ATPase
LAEGISFVEQPARSIAAISAALERDMDPLRLSALHVVTTLTGSLLLALALAARQITAEECWVAAHVDEDVQMETWGRDEEALERRAFRRRDFDAAASVLGG